MSVSILHQGILTLPQPVQAVSTRHLHQTVSCNRPHLIRARRVVFINLVWLPGSQPLAVGTTSVKLQLATSLFKHLDHHLNFLGPDGTAGTYYTNANASIGTMHNGDRYLRYQVLLNTPSATNTPDVSSMAFTYSTACTPPGQVLFQGLSSEHIL